MKKTLFILSCLLSIGTTFAQNWTTDIVNQFCKTNDVSFVVDMSEVNIMGVSIEEFPAYYSGKFHSNETYANAVIKKFTKEFTNSFYKLFNKNQVDLQEEGFINL